MKNCCSARFRLCLARTKVQMYAKTSGNLGAIKWLAPEAIAMKKYDEKTDSYSFGVVLWELYTKGEEPYMDEEILDIALGVSQGLKRPTLPSDVPEDFRRLMLDCWQQDPKLRPDIEEIWTRLQECRKRLIAETTTTTTTTKTKTTTTTVTTTK
jgi:serine/threonine protein kinase